MEQLKIIEYSNIYIKVLEIGESKLSSGIAYCDLLKELKDCIEINNCSTIALKKFFCDNFFHKELHDGKSTVTIAEFEEHLCCNFVMSGEAWNKLQQYRHFQNSKTQIDLLQNQLKTTEQNAQDAKNESSWAFRLAIGSMILSGLGVFIDYLGYKQNEHQNKTTIETTSKPQTETNQKIYNHQNSHDNQTSHDRRENNKPAEDSSVILKTKKSK